MVNKKNCLINIKYLFIKIFIVCLTIFSVIVYRVQLSYMLIKNTFINSYSSIIITVTSAIINLICSLILSPLYNYIAIKITDFGNINNNNRIFK